MPNKDEIYAAWAPPDSLWSPWVKPVLFSFVDAKLEIPPARTISFRSEWVPAPGAAAIILDLPGEEGVLWALKLAPLGYRPVPLYNALPFPPGEMPYAHPLRPPSVVDVESILAAILDRTPVLEKVSLPVNAPPVFMLDAGRGLARTHVKPDTGSDIFDNRSVCFITDFPSAEFLLQNGIKSVVVVQEHSEFARDLIEILISWQAHGIQILKKFQLSEDLPVSVSVKRPSFVSTIWFRLSVALGLRRSKLGGFGGIVPGSSG